MIGHHFAKDCLLIEWVYHHYSFKLSDWFPCIIHMKMNKGLLLTREKDNMEKIAHRKLTIIARNINSSSNKIDVVLFKTII